jgi:hypothetical protein
MPLPQITTEDQLLDPLHLTNAERLVIWKALQTTIHIRRNQWVEDIHRSTRAEDIEQSMTEIEKHNMALGEAISVATKLSAKLNALKPLPELKQIEHYENTHSNHINGESKINESQI